VPLIEPERRASEPPEGADGSATAVDDGEEAAIQNVITWLMLSFPPEGRLKRSPPDWRVSGGGSLDRMVRRAYTSRSV
jgi:hypothetical protein